MATPMVLTASYLNLQTAGDVTPYTSKIEITAEVEDKDVTTFASLGWKTLLGGLKSGNVAVTWKNDINDNMLDELMWPLFGTVITFEARAISTTVTSSNPKYTGSLLVKSWSPIMGSVGDVNEQSATYPTSGAIVRGTS
jgi:hypothetical protein